MTDWLRIVGMIFYAPMRGMREARDRASLAPLMLCAYLSQVLYVFAVQWLSGNRASLRPATIAANLFDAATTLLPIAILLVPIICLVANLFDRKGSFSVVLQQEYATMASTLFYVFVAINLITILSGAFFHFSGIQGAVVSDLMAQAPQILAKWRAMGVPAELVAQEEQLLSDPSNIAVSFFLMTKLWLFAAGTVLAVRAVFRTSVLRVITIVIVSAGFLLLTSQIWGFLFSRVLASPFLLLFVFFLLRGYFNGIVSTQRARTAFKQNLEAATINPRDSSAHYNLGLIHQNRGELDQARERFQRAIDIDQDEIDAHYQLGRIARAQNRLPEAIGHFEEVVQRDQFHAQHEIWREIGATYIAAGQFPDARDALQRFLDRRENDPQGLYLMGRAHAGLGDQREAASSMQACIDAVKTAPAYKYRTEKRWLHEAQQFLKGKKQEAVGR